MELEGVARTWGCRGVRGELVVPELMEGVFAGELVGASAAAEVRLRASARADGHGGGNGETDIEVTDAEWA